MTSASESSKLEGEGRFVEYMGSGKLMGKKVIVTGGEYVSPARKSSKPWSDDNIVPESVGQSQL